MSPTERQIEVLLATIEHTTEKAAAHALGISRGSVKSHIQALYNRLGVFDRTQAAVRLWPLLRHRYRLPGDTEDWSQYKRLDA